MQVSARGEYAVRIAVTLATGHPRTISASALAAAQALPRKFAEVILGDLRRAHLVDSVRGVEGGYRLARDPGDVSVGEVLRAVDGPLSEVRGRRPEETSYEGAAVNLPRLWVAARAAVRSVFDEVSLAQAATGDFPVRIAELTAADDAWMPR
ncbi:MULTISPECIES: RrF2 family transcriptional regulator [Glycomyces]|uniref:Rrf2 family transcriptional regulator n=1 Tax=Glycomyces artemisiae TaxID=1076443 RepID=A0A2T0UFW0_9ACTN|nr:Rrf2 family transcriptional regulator [Glycomyces artemisiae]NUQ91249.1 Rrf2 family transcriptional regulator [Glycomyces artemisiae]PRY56833.1 BadM/Rrf2 family transcriptional regulator [Glycomyces artemisiae]